MVPTNGNRESAELQCSRMLEYRLDDLNWAEFEKLCQALLKARLGVGVESWGGSGDWGNDAYCQAPLRYPGTEVQAGPFQFQAKFVQGANAAGSKPNALLVAAVKRECERITKRKQPVPNVYSLLTNVVLSPELRRTIEDMIRATLPRCGLVVVHSGEDICSWLHLHEDIVRVFPQLLSHRNLAEVIRQSLHADTKDGKTTTPRPELSAALKEAKKAARIASRRHDVDSATVLWEHVQEQAEREGNDAERLCARLETVLVLLRDGPNTDQALELADSCLQDAKVVDLGPDQYLSLQIIGEVHRIKGNKDLARGFITRALEHARMTGSHGDEGYALLSLSALEEPSAGIGENKRAFELIELAYNAFSSLYAAGDVEMQTIAKDGFAQCHSWRAKLLDHARPDEALSEWTRAIDIFRSLGEGREWDVAEALLSRADLQARVGERQLAAGDLDQSAKGFQLIGNTVGVARCYVKAGELLDSLGKRDAAAEPYQQAAAIAATWKNYRKSSYFYFRHGCKLIELKKYQDAERILSGLADSGCLEAETELTVVAQLCLVAHALKNQEELKARCSRALALIDGLIESAVSADRRRSLLIHKGTLFEQLGQHEKALACFHDAIKRFEAVRDQIGVAECWFQIRGVMHALGDRKQEREASERALAIGGDRLSTVLVGLTLVGLAQLNIWEQRFLEARQQLDRAEKLEPGNPAVAMVAADLRRQLPQFSSHNLNDEAFPYPPSEDLSALVQQLRNWCACYPTKRNAILPVWYYIHRTDLSGTIRSMLGVKFLIHSFDAATFETVRKALQAHGDLFIWGTNFASKTKRTPELIPVPKDFLFPAGVQIVSRPGVPVNSTRETKADNHEPLGEPRLLQPVTGPLQEPYYLAHLIGVDGFPDGSPFFAGRKCRLDPKVAKFMLRSPATDLIAERTICIPLTERSAFPNLTRTMRVAWEMGAIPVFPAKLPDGEGINSACDTMLELPSADEAPLSVVREFWVELLSNTEAPKSSLASFSKRMAALHDTEHRVRASVRAYMLQFEAGSERVVHPAVIVQAR